MNIIEHCCLEKQLTETLTRIEGAAGVAHLYSFSDWDLTALLPFFAARTPGGDITVCMPRLTPETMAMLRGLMKRVYVDTATKEERKLVNRLTLIINQPSIDEKAQLYNFLGGCDERLLLCEDRIGFRALMMSNGDRHFVIQGSINQGKSDYTQMFTLTTSHALYDEAMELINGKRKLKAIKGWAGKYKEIVDRQWSVMNVDV